MDLPYFQNIYIKWMNNQNFIYTRIKYRFRNFCCSQLYYAGSMQEWLKTEKPFHSYLVLRLWNWIWYRMIAHNQWQQIFKSCLYIIIFINWNIFLINIKIRRNNNNKCKNLIFLIRKSTWANTVYFHTRSINLIGDFYRRVQYIFILEI